VERGSAAAKAGLKKGEVIADMDGQTVSKIADTRLALWDKKPGDRVRVGVRQEHGSSASRTSLLEIELAAPAKERP
jgi:S1-C subfamily serine protease